MEKGIRALTVTGGAAAPYHFVCASCNPHPTSNHHYVLQPVPWSPHPSHLAPTLFHPNVSDSQSGATVFDHDAPDRLVARFSTRRSLVLSPAAFIRHARSPEAHTTVRPSFLHPSTNTAVRLTRTLRGDDCSKTFTGRTFRAAACIAGASRAPGSRRKRSRLVAPSLPSTPAMCLCDDTNYCRMN